MLKARPLLRWAGSKNRQFSEYYKHFPNTYRRYAEPFSGSASFLFSMQDCEAHLNDINEDVISFYAHVVDEQENFYAQFSALKRGRDEYYAFRDEFNQIEKSFRRSLLFYYLNRNCFNGLYRVNKKGHFNVPYSDSRVSSYLSLEEFIRSVKILKGKTFSCGDFASFCQKTVEPADFVFLDPPYFSNSVRVFSDYHHSGFGATDVPRLREVLSMIDERNAYFLLSFPVGQIAEILSDGWQTRKIEVRRTMAGDLNMRRSDHEVLISNYE